jgi:hypothetical protein
MFIQLWSKVMVVPAHAGTHTPRLLFWRLAGGVLLSSTAVGPCFRRDDLTAICRSGSNSFVIDDESGQGAGVCDNAHT